MAIRKTIVERQGILKPLLKKFTVQACWLETRVTPYRINKAMIDAEPDANDFKAIEDFYLGKEKEYQKELIKS